MARALFPLAPAFLACTAPILLSGCIGTASKVVTAPVRVVSKGADWATTSQSEADRNRGREIRKREERLGELHRDYARHSERCDRGNEDACESARAEYAEIQRLSAMVPVER